MSVYFQWIEPQIGLLKLNRPQVRNALNWEGMQAFAEAVERAHLCPDLKALVLTGAGSAFCSGGDLKELADYGTLADGERLAALMTRALNRLVELPCPTIAAVNGPARGGGAEIALACDLRVLDEKADLGMMHVNIGITPAWGGGQRLLRLVGYGRALEWLTTGRILSAEEALANGLANCLTPVGESLAGALDLARQIAARLPAAVRAIKRFLLAGLTHSPDAAARLEQEAFPPLWAADEHHALVERFINHRRG